jgi:hypothetical protein
LLSLIAAAESTPTALVTPEEVEQASDACIAAWCRQVGVSPEAVTRSCTLYLKPQREGETLRDVLQTS